MKSKTPNIVTILILTLVTVFTWIGFSVYRAFAVKPSPKVSSQISSPLSPSLNIDVIEKIRNKIFVPETEIIQTIIPVTTEIPSASPTPTSTPTDTPEAVPTIQ